MRILEASKSKGAALVAYQLKNKVLSSQKWKFKWHPVCASTEKELSLWLQREPLLQGQLRAVLAGRQNFGRGQFNRVWLSPLGGVWISAALSGCQFPRNGCLFGLEVAVAIAKCLEKKGVPVKIKWPNDLVVSNKKLAGFLPRLVSRGEELIMARVGLGLNVRNKVPEEGISISNILGKSFANTSFWSAEILFALGQVLENKSNPDYLLAEVERRLWQRIIIDPLTGLEWKILGIDNNGALILTRKGIQKILRR